MTQVPCPRPLQMYANMARSVMTKVKPNIALKGRRRKRRKRRKRWERWEKEGGKKVEERGRKGKKEEEA